MTAYQNCASTAGWGLVRFQTGRTKSTVFLGDEIADSSGNSVLKPRGTGFFCSPFLSNGK
jgi:hypothetical protein